MSSMSRRTLPQPSAALAVPPEPASSKEVEIAIGDQTPVDAEWAAATRARLHNRVLQRPEPIHVRLNPFNGDDHMPTERNSRILNEVLDANASYAADFGDKKDLALPPARGFAILTCMDARLDPAKYAGLAEGDAHVIRNAGGRATDDAIRSLVISHKLLGTNEWFVIHHSNCGMELFSDEVIGDLLEDSLETAAFDGKAWSNPKHGHGSSHGHFVKWHTIGDQEESVEQDVRRIREHPLVPGHIPIHGYIYDVHNGRLVEVKAATAAGRAD